MSSKRKRGPGRPPLGDDAASATVRVRLHPDDADRWRTEADERDMTLSEMIRARVDVTTRIEVSRDEEDWHWTAYNESGRVLATCGIEHGPSLATRVRKAAGEMGLRGADDAAVEIES